MPARIINPELRSIKASEGVDAIMKAVRADGACIIKGLISAQSVQRLNEEIEAGMEAIKPGCEIDEGFIKEFHGDNTKRFTNVVASSKTFRDELLENELLHEICTEVFVADHGAYWFNSAQAIEIGPGSKEQALHRDQWQYPILSKAGPYGRELPEALMNFMVALNEFTEESGATRVIPGSHKWEDLNDNGKPEETVPALMQPGDAWVVAGRTVHGGGRNKTTDYKRRGLSVSFVPSYITPEEAMCFLVPRKLVETLSPRSQNMLGYRSQMTKDSAGFWKSDYADKGIDLHPHIV